MLKLTAAVDPLLGRVILAVVFVFAQLLSPVAAAAPVADRDTRGPDFGSNVLIFDPSMPTSQIQVAVDGIARQQLSNQFGTQRFALLFKPGTYGTDTPLNFQVGYYTTVGGLGLSPRDVVINGSIDVYNQCDASGFCIALTNFWRSLSNLTINVDNRQHCVNGEYWAVSQAAPIRRVQVNGFASLMDFCTSPAFASGGFIADAQFTGSTIVNGSQQQWFTRNSVVDGWSNGVWNQVFAGVSGAPAQCFPAQKSCGGPYTTLPTSPISREAPFLYVDAAGRYNVFVPAVQRNSSGISWSNGPGAGRSIPIDEFFIAKPDDRGDAINDALARGKNVILSPGVYAVDRTIRVRRPDTIVLGLGIPTLVPQDGTVTMTVADVPGVEITGVLFDAGQVSSPVLLKVGARRDQDDDREIEDDIARGHHDHHTDNPVSLHDVFFRVGGATPGKASTSLEVNSNDALLDDVWIWRADHGNGVGWTANTADTGLVVNGDDVTALGLFVEHFQKFEVIWNGNGGTVVFFQNEMPYDPPSQAAWMEAPGVNGWSAFKVASSVARFSGFGLGSYSFFNQGVQIFAEHAFEVPATLPAGSLHDLLTVFLDPTHGSGGITHVVNEAGGSSTVANPDTPVTVVSYP